MPAGTVAAVVRQRDRLGERDVEAQGTGDRRGHLRHLERMGQAGALVVVGEHEDLRLPGEAPEGAGVQDPVAVALEAGAERVGRLVVTAAARAPARVAPGARCRSSSASRSSRRSERTGPTLAWLSAWASRSAGEAAGLPSAGRPSCPAIVDAHACARSVAMAPTVPTGCDTRAAGGAGVRRASSGQVRAPAAGRSGTPAACWVG